jgi:hypothetical protein
VKKVGMCPINGGVYKITSIGCGDFYIGETIILQPLYIEVFSAPRRLVQFGKN